jgi:hypothetical protein
VIPVIEQCVAQAHAASGEEGEDLERRLAQLLEFVQRFDRGVDLFVRGEPQAIERVFAVLEQLDSTTVNKLWQLIDELEPDEMAGAVRALAKLPPRAVHRLISIADSAPMRRLLGVR